MNYRDVFPVLNPWEFQRHAHNKHGRRRLLGGVFLLEGGGRELLLVVEQLVSRLQSMAAWLSCSSSSVFVMDARLRPTARVPCSVLPLPDWFSSGWSSVARGSALAVSPLAARSPGAGLCVATLLVAGAAPIEPG